jgi:6-pyruvoyltetrahydropterin/6-carboxytetrahydropterin synthase
MIQVTKIFRFEMAHAIHGYPGHCRNIHGHSYVLHVTVAPQHSNDEYLPSPGFIIDFKELKHLVNTSVIQLLDHRLILSDDFIRQHNSLNSLENLTIWKMEPTAENILLFIRNTLQNKLPQHVVLHKLKIYETSDSYAEWENKER